jgi:hypothetical protein
MVVSLTVGVTNYLRFLDKQRLYQSGSNIEAIFKDARNKAQNGFLGNEDVGFCSKLGAIEVSSALDASNKISSTARVRCSDGSFLTYDSYTIDQTDTLLNQSFKISFLPMRGAVVLLNNIPVSSGSAIISRGGSKVTFNLDQGGTIDVKYE